MTELEGLRANVVPRPDEVCAAFARRIEPLGGFLAYGVLWLFVVTNTALLAGLFAGIGLGKLVDSEQVAAVSAAALAVILAGGSVWLYIAWCRRKRRRAAAFIRDGVFVDGQIEDKATDRAAQLAAKLAFAAAGQALGVTWYRVAFARDGARYHVLCPFARPPQAGDVAPVLFVPDYKYALGFETTGRAYVCRLHRD